MANGKSLEDTMIVRTSLLKIFRKNIASVGDRNEVPGNKVGESGQALLKIYSPLACPSFLEKFMDSLRVKGVKSYSVFTFEPLPNLHLEIS